MYRSKKTTRWLLSGLLLTLVVGTVKTLPEPTPASSRLDEIRDRGKLVVLTRNGASSYFVGAEGPTGPEYELAEAFAAHLGVDIEARVASSYDQLGQWLENNEGDLIAANLTQTPERARQFRFGPGYASTHTSLVYRKGLTAPQNLADLAGLRVAVIAGSSYEEFLTEASGSTPDLVWESRDNAGIEDLLLDIDHGDLDATLVDSRVFRIHNQYYPGVMESVTVGDEQSQAWAFQYDDDDSLALQAEIFIGQAREQGLLDDIQQQFFASGEQHLKDHDMLRFLERVRERLPIFMHVFQDVGSEYGVDWRLLAAMGYQESHWDPNAVSPTGVRGLMMLTMNTAKQMGLDDRLNPDDSIDGGARYFLHVKGKLPDRIQNPDRAWMALAAYNIGFGHLEDARVLTERQGGNPDVWTDVKQRLPLLTQEKYYRDTRYGYARGHEAHQYVENIRRFYETLIWMDTREHPLLASNMLAAP